MSERHPIIAITGSSGAGTSTVTRTFQNIFRREELTAAVIEGDSFHRYDRKAMKVRMADEEAKGNQHFSHFGAEGNLFEEIEEPTGPDMEEEEEPEEEPPTPTGDGGS